MIPVEQTRVGKLGNCFPACLASILEIPLTDVPDFTGDGDDWLYQVADFMNDQGLYYAQIPADDDVIRVMFDASDPLWHTIEGISPRGGRHAVVGDRGVMKFDPHPEDGTGRGLVKVECYGLLCARMK